MKMTNEERKERARWQRIKRVYGMTKEQYHVLASTDCPICLRPFSNSVRPVIDHDHATREIRGIICRHCNHRFVGNHRDPDKLQRVVDYLRSGHTGIIAPKKKSRKRRARKAKK